MGKSIISDRFINSFTIKECKQVLGYNYFGIRIVTLMELARFTGTITRMYI